MNQFSGAPIEDFEGGWARFPFAGSKGHYWHESNKMIVAYISSCGLHIAPRHQPLGLGTMPVCKKCLKNSPLPNREDLKTFIDSMPSRKESEHV